MNHEAPDAGSPANQPDWPNIQGGVPMTEAHEIELVFEPQEGGGYHVYAPELPGLHTQGDDMDEAMANANEAVALYVEGLREDGESLDRGIVRRKITLPA
jgi:predicted RNase H-like HicB family nuclease